MKHHDATRRSQVGKYRDDPDRCAWPAPAAATVLGPLLAPAALLLGALSPMATDSCGPDNCSQALTTALKVLFVILVHGGILGVGAWLALWLLPRTRRWSVLRVWLAGLSLLPWMCALALVLNLPDG